jgi:tight adherence protein B
MPVETLLMIVVGVAVFVFVACVWGMVVLVIGTRRRQREQAIGARLGLIDPITQETAGGGETRTLRLWHDGKEATTHVLSGRQESLLSRFQRQCRDAGWEAPVKTILLGLVGGMCGALALVLLLTGSLLAGIGGAAVVFMGFRMMLNMKGNRRRTLFENQLIDALELAARSLRVGHPLPGAFRLASEEIGAPVGVIFGNIVQQQELGVPLDQAVSDAAGDSTSEDLKLFATAVVIQIRSGGNLADMMERVVAVMRDRMRLARRVRVLTAQTQFSKQVLLALPVGMFVLLNLMNPEYMKPLYTTGPGQMILGASAGMLCLGAWVMGKLAAIKY